MPDFKPDMMNIIAETDRLIIRELVPEDLPALRKISSPKDREKLGETEEKLLQEDFFLAYIRNQYAFFGFGIWALVLKETGELIGKAGLSPLEEPFEPQDGTDDAGDILELCYHVGTEFRRRGYALEALKAVLFFGQKELDVHRYLVRTGKNNIPSRELIRKLNMETGPGTENEVTENETSRPETAECLRIYISNP